MYKQKSNIAIKVVIFILLALLIVLIPIKAMAAPAPTCKIRSLKDDCYEGEVTVIEIKIINDTGVEIMPTSYFLDGTQYQIGCGFLSVGQTHTINHNKQVFFNGQSSVTYSFSLIYHEDGGGNTQTAGETVTIPKSEMLVITPTPMTAITPTPTDVPIVIITPTPMAVITPTPTSTPMVVITPSPTPEPRIDVPTPDLSNMSVVTPTPTPASAPNNNKGNASAAAPTPQNTPTPAPTPESVNNSSVDKKNQEEDEDNLIAVSNDDTLLTYKTNDAENAHSDISKDKSYSISGLMQSEGIKNIANSFYRLDTFTKICLGVIAVLSLGFIFLAIKISNIKKNKEK